MAQLLKFKSTKNVCGFLSPGTTFALKAIVVTFGSASTAGVMIGGVFLTQEAGSFFASLHAPIYFVGSLLTTVMGGEAIKLTLKGARFADNLHLRDCL